MSKVNSFQSASTLKVGNRTYRIYRLDAVEQAGIGKISRLPYSIRILLENLLRSEDNRTVRRSDIEYVASWDLTRAAQDINFRPARILMQDFTGVPAVVDLATMRDALKKMGKDPKLANPLIPADLVIDHSVQVDNFGAKDSFDLNVLLEYQRNQERYALLRWAQGAFRNFRVVPPGTGIVHQVNLEYLAPVVFRSEIDGETVAYPDTLLGTDSHTTMINGIGVVGWGVGGIEAEACMLGQPITMLLPPVVGFKLTGKPAEGATATDVVLTVTQMLRKKGVVGKFVEFFGPGVKSLSLADRATIANMAPEYGATIGFFPIDEASLDYLRLSNRPADLVDLVEAYTREQGLFLTDDAVDPVYNDTLTLDLATVVPSLAGPKRPQDRIELPGVKKNFTDAFGTEPKSTPYEGGELKDGAVVIAAITSCTNTSNPSVMLAAGLLARNAVAKGLKVKPWVKTSLAPGSKVVMDYFEQAGVVPAMDALGFNLVGYGCTTCIGNSGPLPAPVAKAVTDGKLTVAAVLSGNRNFEGRVNPLVKANYLASPPLVVAYALAGSVDVDLKNEPLGEGSDGAPVYLRDIWPSNADVQAAVMNSVTQAQFEKEYSVVFEGDSQWKAIKVATGDLFDWDERSTYIRRPPYFDEMVDPATSVTDMTGLRVLVSLGDSITTDHISPAGNIAKDSAAARYLNDNQVAPQDYNQYGARRGNHEVMMRGTLANIRLKNLLAGGTEGPVTVHQPSGDKLTIYDAAMRYKQDGVGQIILAGKEYGSGSSRDWAAKGVQLLGVKAAIAESYERIHRSNLVGMGVLPLQFAAGESRETLGLTGLETFAISGVAEGINKTKRATVTATAPDGTTKEFVVVVRIDTPMEAEYFRYGGILPYVLQHLQ